MRSGPEHRRGRGPEGLGRHGHIPMVPGWHCCSRVRAAIPTGSPDPTQEPLGALPEGWPRSPAPKCSCPLISALGDSKLICQLPPPLPFSRGSIRGWPGGFPPAGLAAPCPELPLRSPLRSCFPAGHPRRVPQPGADPAQCQRGPAGGPGHPRQEQLPRRGNTGGRWGHVEHTLGTAAPCPRSCRAATSPGPGTDAPKRTGMFVLCREKGHCRHVSHRVVWQ